jgi:iron complex transport system ATP-binding protein
MRMSLRADHLSFAYSDGQVVLNDLCFELMPGELHFIVGANGCGKSTLLHCLSTNESTAFLPQTIQPSQRFSVREAVELGARTSGHSNIEDLMLQLDIKHLAQRDLDQLSGGEYQRVLVASVLAERSNFLLLDEPSSSLDLHHQVHLFRILKSFCAEGLGIAVVCHDWNIASRYADTISILHDGEILDSGTPQKVITSTNLTTLFGNDVVIIKINNLPVVVPSNE